MIDLEFFQHLYSRVNFFHYCLNINCVTAIVISDYLRATIFPHMTVHLQE
jgi:hypothetical protein